MSSGPAEVADTNPTKLTLSGTAAGPSGAATAVLAIPPRGVPWTVTQVSNELTPDPTPGVIPSSAATCVMRVNGRAVTPLVPQLDAAGGDPPLPLWPSDTLTVEWAGLNPGDMVFALVLYTPGTYS